MSIAAMPASPAVAAQIRALRAGGASYNEIAAALNQNGVRGRLGGRWFPSSVRRALQGLDGGNESHNELTKESQCKV